MTQISGRGLGPAQAFVGAFRDSGNKFLDFRMTQEEKRKKSDKEAMKAVITQAEALGRQTNYDTGGVERGISHLKSNLASASTEQKVLLKRAMDSLRLRGEGASAKALTSFTQQQKLDTSRLADLSSISTDPSTLQAGAKEVKAIGGKAGESLALFEPFAPMGPVFETVTQRARLQAAGRMSMAEAIIAMPIETIMTDAQEDDLDKLYIASTGSDFGLEGWKTRFKKVRMSSRSKLAMRFAVDDPIGGQALGLFDPAVVSQPAADYGMARVVEFNKAKKKTSDQAALKKADAGLDMAFKARSPEMVKKVADTYEQETGRSDYANQMRDNAAILANGGPLESIGDLMRKEMAKQIVRGNMPTKIGADGVMTEEPMTVVEYADQTNKAIAAMELYESRRKSGKVPTPDVVTAYERASDDVSKLLSATASTAPGIIANMQTAMKRMAAKSTDDLQRYTAALEELGTDLPRNMRTSLGMSDDRNIGRMIGDTVEGWDLFGIPGAALGSIGENLEGLAGEPIKLRNPIADVFNVVNPASAGPKLGEVAQAAFNELPSFNALSIQEQNQANFAKRDLTTGLKLLPKIPIQQMQPMRRVALVKQLTSPPFNMTEEQVAELNLAEINALLAEEAETQAQ